MASLKSQVILGSIMNKQITNNNNKKNIIGGRLDESFINKRCPLCEGEMVQVLRLSAQMRNNNNNNKMKGNEEDEYNNNNINQLKFEILKSLFILKCSKEGCFGLRGFRRIQKSKLKSKSIVNILKEEVDLPSIETDSLTNSRMEEKSDEPWSLNLPFKDFGEECEKNIVNETKKTKHNKIKYETKEAPTEILKHNYLPPYDLRLYKEPVNKSSINNLHSIHNELDLIRTPIEEFGDESENDESENDESENDEENLDLMIQYTEVINLSSDQIIRYSTNLKPLLMEQEKQIDSYRISEFPPNCKCGAKRTLECQVLPSIVYLAKWDETCMDENWTSLLFFTCSEECDRECDHEEFVEMF